MRAALKQGKTFTLNIELNDGRIIAVVNQPMEGGGWVATHEDITERKRAERELGEHPRVSRHDHRKRAVADHREGCRDLQYRLINRAAEKYLGVDRAAILGKTAGEIMPQATAETIERARSEADRFGKPIYVDEHAIVTPGNGIRIVTATRLPVKGEDGKTQYLITVIHDLTDRKRDEQRIAHMAHHDSLTDLPNRAAFNECIAATLDLAAASGESFAVLCTDLDRFKAVNDVFGHATGDELLREVASRLEMACQGAFLARLGGDEFSVITPTGPQPADGRSARRAAFGGARHRYRHRRSIRCGSG